MISEGKVTEIYCIADDFCKFFDTQMAKYTIQPQNKRKYHRDSTLSKAEVITIMILFHGSGYRCLKHFYLEHVCKHLRHLFPKVVSYNRFVELEHEVAIPLAIFIKKVLLGKCTGISFVDSTPLRVCRNQRIHIHKTFKGIAQRGKCSMAKGNRVIEVNHRLKEYKRKATMRLTSKEGIRHRGRRCIEPEAVFGQMKADYGYKRFRHFGKDKVEMDFAFFAIAFNLKKMCRKAPKAA